MTDDAENGYIHRTLGKLEESGKNLNRNVDSLVTSIKEADDKSAQYRREMRETVDEINDKVDPLLNRIDLLELTVKAHAVILKSYADKELELRGAARLGRWLIHGFWFLIAAAAMLFSGDIKGFVKMLFR